MQNIPLKDKDINKEVCKTYLQKIRKLRREGSHRRHDKLGVLSKYLFMHWLANGRVQHTQKIFRIDKK